ncbi:RNA-directed DNA polymerase, eukaryota, reverse transcriptase zinc-binding domain protein [Tanacetum coccineum]|uniref:RNA-directed DNA polymerase, eukaryota, reverse transcriptase zinc-binding domain protein n=1 Tax=Tanacetum coccineum TaxID=301880 RepID=A0ABQ4YHX5_9ASTR
MERRNLDKYTKEQDYTGKKVDKKANDKKRNMEKFSNKYAVLAEIKEGYIDNLNEIKEKSMVDNNMVAKDFKSSYSDVLKNDQLGVEPIRSNHKFFVTIVYGSNNGKERKELWSDLQNQSNSIQNKPYALMGDFNVTLRFDEHSTGEAFATTDMQDFQKLDRIMVNEPFMELFKDAYACFFPYLISDHSPVILSFPTTLYKKNKAFKFENYVANKDEFITVVKNGWELQTQGFELYKLVTKLKILKKPLNHLNWKNGNLTEKVERLSKELKEDEEKLLCQQAKVDWLKEGDKSSAYFHKIIKGRRHQNHIPTINDEDGADVVTKDMEECNIIFDNQVSTKDALGLIQEVTDKEIHNAICDTDDNKAPGPDGFTSTFYKKAWPVIRKDMCRAIKEFFTKGSLLKELNATLITLVPKIPNPSKVSEFRPIACCNVIYKCITKIITNKIKRVLSKVVDINHSAFILGRNITDNILLTQELLKGYNWKNGKQRAAPAQLVVSFTSHPRGHGSKAGSGRFLLFPPPLRGIPRDPLKCNDMLGGSHLLTRGGGCPMTACHVAASDSSSLQVAANDWWQVRGGSLTWQEQITKKRTKNKAKTTKLDTEWKSCKGQGQSKAKDQISQVKVNSTNQQSKPEP